MRNLTFQMLLVTRQVVNNLRPIVQYLNENNMTINKVTNITEWVRNIKEGGSEVCIFPEKPGTLCALHCVQLQQGVRY